MDEDMQKFKDDKIKDLQHDEEYYTKKLKKIQDELKYIWNVK